MNPIVEHIRNFPINSIFDVEMLINTISVNYSNIPNLASTMRFIFDKLETDNKASILGNRNNFVFRTSGLSDFRRMFKGLKSVDNDGGYQKYFDDSKDDALILFIHKLHPDFAIYSFDNYLQDGDGSDAHIRLLPLFYKQSFSMDACLQACATRESFREYSTFFSSNYSWFIEHIKTAPVDESARACYVGIESLLWLADSSMSSAGGALHFRSVATELSKHAQQLNPELHKIYSVLKSVEALGSNPVRTLFEQYQLEMQPPAPLPSL